jgi:type I restriction enzyme R subunit
LPRSHITEGVPGEWEEAIEHSLLTHGGYHEAPRDAFDADLALLPSVLVGFLQETQPEKWGRLAEQYWTRSPD